MGTSACNTHQGVIFSLSLSRVGFVVWELESSRASLGISESSSEVWYSSYIFPFDIYQYKLSSLSFRVSFTFRIYLPLQVIQLVFGSSFL
jgi:hypothetical protein